jgi:hypothetical protein
MPYILWQQEIQIMQRNGQITILYMLDHQVRHVGLNGQHPARVTPSWSGDSVGHYEGETLVIATVGVKVGPLSMVDMFGELRSLKTSTVWNLFGVSAPSALNEPRTSCAAAASSGDDHQTLARKIPRYAIPLSCEHQRRRHQRKHDALWPLPPWISQPTNNAWPAPLRLDDIE